MTVSFHNAPSYVIAGLAINCIVFIFLLCALSYLLWVVLTKGRGQFHGVVTTMVRIRRRMKKSQFTLDEFLQLCRLMGITCDHVTAIFKAMHSNRQKTGEKWLFDEPSDKKKSPISGGKSMVIGAKGQRRNIPIFRDFAKTSQFTQGYDGYAMHRLLHSFRPCEFQSADSPEGATQYQLTDMCNTLRQSNLNAAASLKDSSNTIPIGKSKSPTAAAPI